MKNSTKIMMIGKMKSNSLGFPKPAAPRPETRLAGYKRNRAIDRTFSFQCSHDAASPDGAASPPRRGGA